MKKIDWYISDDGKCRGSEQEVREYEDKQNGPLNGMHFPYFALTKGGYEAVTHEIWTRYPNSNPIAHKELNAVIAFVNLAPLIARWMEWDYGDELEVRKNDHNARGDLLRAFDEACKLIPKE